MLAGDVDPKSSMQSVSSESRDLINWARLLERRVSFARWAAAESCAVLSDEPKNFIKLCATNAAGGCRRLVHSLAAFASRRRSGRELLAVAGVRFYRHRGTAARSRRRAGGRRRLGPIRLRHVLLDIDFAFKVRALFNRDPLGGDIAHGDG